MRTKRPIIVRGMNLSVEEACRFGFETDDRTLADAFCVALFQYRARTGDAQAEDGVQRILEKWQSESWVGEKQTAHWADDDSRSGTYLSKDLSEENKPQTKANLPEPLQIPKAIQEMNYKPYFQTAVAQGWLYDNYQPNFHISPLAHLACLAYVILYRKLDVHAFWKVAGELWGVNAESLRQKFPKKDGNEANYNFLLRVKSVYNVD